VIITVRPAIHCLSVVGTELTVDFADARVGSRRTLPDRAARAPDSAPASWAGTAAGFAV
jgi:hypothetical protein